MPGGNGTGPAGMGSMTGRAAGYCAGYSTPGYMNLGLGFGRGFGRGRGFRRGIGRDFGYRTAAYYYPNPYSSSASISPKQEADMLKEQLKAIQNEFDMVNNRIKELELGTEPKK